ncbi:protein MAEA homolog [Nicotiana tabacum]|uniref:Macrophage erythroblast attacher-like n=1 Tax=Nicotiana tabacum TaxID=4097 RepID=A0A1S4DMQ0_TOBAC|nr:PREDICTED: macrophage erythroblast attacher-like [Nicotiana tabacum]
MEMETIPNGSSPTSTASSTAVTPTAVTPTAGISPNAPSSKLNQLSESLKLEHQFLRVPFEHYKKTIRSNHRIVEKEVSAVISGVSDAAAAADSVMSRDDAVNRLNSLVSRLQGLKRKLEEGSRTENLQAQRCRARLDHLESADPENLSDWNDTRLKRILVDYMLRMSYYDTAMKLAESSNIQDLVDVDVFHEAKKVIDALQNKEVTPALAWCADNKSRLKKSKSKFEFQLRLQEFIELVRAENMMRAITYARKYLAPWGSTHMKELQRVLATLAFKSNTECATYKALFEPKQWNYLIDQFKQEFCKLYGMTLEPLLNIYLQAGLSALKTPFCYEDDCTKEDPLSQESFRKLATPLPYSKQHHSKLVCYITKELMDTENPPLVLPNGYVYSTKALEEMAKRNDGRITCPRTGFTCNYTQLVKAYIS